MSTEFMFIGADPTHGADNDMFQHIERKSKGSRPTGRGSIRVSFTSLIPSLVQVMLTAAAAFVLHVGIEGQTATGSTLSQPFPVARSAPDPEDPALDISRSGLSEAGKCVAFEILEDFCAAAPHVQVIVDPTDDGGLMLSFEHEATGRTITYAIPHSGRHQFLVAEEGDAYWAGEVTRRRGHRKLAEWVTGASNSRTINGVEWAS